MKAIGGYFELADREAYGCYPVDGIRLNTARNAFEYIISHLPDAKHIYLPLYTCDAVLQPFRHLPNIGFSFYHINNKFELADDINLYDGEYILANNYFGIKDAYISELEYKYRNRLIVDNAQALFAPAHSEIKTIYSTRKYVGVADGGIAVGIDSLDVINYEQDDSSDHDSHLVIRKNQGAEAGFKDFQKNECCLVNRPIRKMSLQTEDVLTHIDYRKVIEKRRQNYEKLHESLGRINQLPLPEPDTFVCPLVYPFIGRTDNDLRSKLIANRIFVATYWPNVFKWCDDNDVEYKFAKYVLPLPIDQRYGEEDMERILKLLNH